MVASRVSKYLTWQVKPDALSQRVDQFLVSQTELDGQVGLSRARLQALIKDGCVQVNGQTVRPAHKVQSGDTIHLYLPEPEPCALVPVAMPLDILFEDQDMLVLNKPPLLVVHPGHGTTAPTLVHGLLAHCHDLSGIGGVLRPGIVHRLDAGTSGALVVAKNDRAHVALAKQFAQRQVTKQYVTIVRGLPKPAHGTCISNLIRHPQNRLRFCSHKTQGRRAVTHYRVLAHAWHLSLLQILLETGRTHQIRVHMSEMNTPILGDPVYKGLGQGNLPLAELAPELAASMQGLSHQALHARMLQLTHPRTHAQMRFDAPLPESWRNLAQALQDTAGGVDTF